MKENIKCEFQVEGMHCAGCELYIEKELQKINGNKKVDAHLSSSTVEVEIDNSTDIEKYLKTVNSKLSETGYKLKHIDLNNESASTSSQSIKYSLKEIVLSIVIAIIILILYFILQKLPISGNIESENKYIFPILYGFIASLSSCMAVVGSVVLSISSNYSRVRDKILPLTTFHISRLVGFFVLGALLGYIGSLFLLNTTFYFIINTILFIIMIIMGLSLTDLFPSLNKFQFRIPKQIANKLLPDTNDKISGYFSNIILPSFLGIITFFLPCGFTQAIQFQAMTIGIPFSSGITMLMFAIGTFPTLALISFTTVKLSEGSNKKIFFLSSSIMIIFFAIYTYGLFIFNTILPQFY